MIHTVGGKLPTGNFVGSDGFPSEGDCAVFLLFLFAHYYSIGAIAIFT